MPVTKSAIKKLRKDRKRTARNALFKKQVKQAVKNAKRQKTVDLVKEAISLIDKAAKKNIFHKNKAARLKSKLSRLVKEAKAKVGKKEEKTSQKTKRKKPKISKK